MKAIETIYNGYRFRSRLEARWAVFFDSLNIKYRYEMEGFEIDGIRYLPDFWLPKQDFWVEVKGVNPSPEEINKAGLLASESQKDVVLLFGDAWKDVEILMFSSNRPQKRVLWHVSTAIDNNDLYIAVAIIKCFRNNYWYPEVELIKRKLKQEGDPQLLKIDLRIIEEHKYKPTLPYRIIDTSRKNSRLSWKYCTSCNLADISAGENRYCNLCEKEALDRDHPLLEKAYTDARQARFETY